MLRNKITIDNISKSDLLDFLKFDSDDEKKKFKEYVRLKGINTHVDIINLIGLDENDKICAKHVSDTYKYDKRIRNILFTYISALEEHIRAFARDNNENEKESFVSKIENKTLNQLIEHISVFKETFKSLFPNNDNHLIDNLKAVKGLRNAVSHNRLLLTYNNYKHCYINGEKKKGLTNNIKNLVNLIDDYYKDSLINKINNACFEEDDPLFVPEHLIIKI